MASYQVYLLAFAVLTILAFLLPWKWIMAKEDVSVICPACKHKMSRCKCELQREPEGTWVSCCECGQKSPLIDFG